MNITRSELVYRLTHQKNHASNLYNASTLSNSDIEEISPKKFSAEYRRISDALDKAGVDVRWGIERLSLFPEYKDQILPVYYQLFPTINAQGKDILAGYILNMKPEKKDANVLVGLFLDELGKKETSNNLLWSLAQPVARAIDSSEYGLLEKLIDNERPGNYRLFFLERLAYAQDKALAQELAFKMLDADDFETVGGAITALKKLKAEIPADKLRKLQNHPAVYIRKQAAKLLAD